MMPPVRRVVTGHNAAGQAVIVSDSARTPVALRGGGFEFHSVEMWRTDATPAPIPAVAPDPTGGPRRQSPAPGGSVFRLNTFMPGQAGGLPAEQRQQALAEIGSSAAVNLRADAPHPLMHRTRTIDYAIVLSGQITLILDEAEVDLKAGDVVVQCGTSHAWSNKGGEPCTVAFVMLDGEFSAELEAAFGAAQPGQPQAR